MEVFKHWPEFVPPVSKPAVSRCSADWSLKIGNGSSERTISGLETRDTAGWDACATGGVDHRYKKSAGT
jgi:hypothetical protein